MDSELAAEKLEDCKVSLQVWEDELSCEVGIMVSCVAYFCMGSMMNKA